MAFTHLHVHTEYSLLDGSGKIKEMVKRAKELGMDALAITDHGAMYGCIDFYRACRAEGIKPIIGCEVYVAPGSRFDKESSATDDRYNHLVLLAENDKGYSNLMKIVSKGYTEGFYYKPRVDKEVLREFHEGIIALSACLAGEVPMLLRRGFYEEARKSCLEHLEIFGEGNYFLELQDHGIPEQTLVNQDIMRLHNETGIPLVATNDIHYVRADDAEAHDILLCIQTQKKVTDENRMRYEGGQFYLKSEDEMRALFPYAREAIDNTHDISERCNVEIEFGNYKLPKYDVPAGYTAESYLRELCDEGLKKRYPKEYDDYTTGVDKSPWESLYERLSYELNIVVTMGFVDYFLIVWDFIHFAKENGISVGPGRGSGAGSIAAYALTITDIDPIRYNLIFERFLNPERVTMPDFDIDFCFERRQEVIDYVHRKYGNDRVVQIVTFGSMLAKGVIRDVGRALDMPYARVDAIAKMIPFELGITIDRALEISKDLKEVYTSDPEITRLIDMGRRLEGLPRNTSIHAAGVVISNAPVDEYVPLSRAADGSITTQYTMTTLEELGLLKMDFLGLRTLTVIQNAERMAIESGSAPKDFSIETISYEDEKVYDLISSAKTEGVFQLESTGMKSFMKELRPRTMEDIIAGISLYRPGPMDFIPNYIKGKNDPSSVKYDCPQMEPILEATYGCMVYQEQVMQIVRDLAGYSFGRSDIVRRAMAKKKHDVMQREKEYFINGNPELGVPGCVANGISADVARKIFDDMTDFANYAFNKSHAAAYAVVAYRTAYMKEHYPVEFMAALMSSVIDNPSKVAGYIYVCRQMNIQIMPPDINEGVADFTVSDGKIRYALSAIKGLGRPVIDAIVTERERGGRYTSLRDFIFRVSPKEANKRTIESLIKAGAFDSLNGTRKQHMQIYVKVCDGVARDRKNELVGQISLFDMMGDPEEREREYELPDVGEYRKEEILAFEKEVLGVYLSGHPLDDYMGIIKRHVTCATTDFMLDDETGTVKVEDGSTQTIGGVLLSKTLKLTRSNQNMAFITIEDIYGTIEVIVFPRDYEKFRKYLETDEKLLITGRVSVEEDKDARLIASEIKTFDMIPRELWIKFPSKDDYIARERELLETLAESDGRDTVVIYLEAEKAMKRLERNYSVQVNGTLLEKLKARFGEKAVAVKD